MCKDRIFYFNSFTLNINNWVLVARSADLLGMDQLGVYISNFCLSFTRRHNNEAHIRFSPLEMSAIYRRSHQRYAKLHSLRATLMYQDIAVR